MAPLGAPHDLLARALALVVLTGGALAGLALLVRRERQPAAGPAIVVGAAFAGIVAGALAVRLAGPGALVWLLLASLAGLALRRAERPPTDELSEETGPVRQAVRAGQALAATLAALAAGALLHAQQAAEAVQARFPAADGALGAILAFGTAACLLGLGRAGERAAQLLARLGLVALALFVGFALAFLAGERAAAVVAVRDALDQAFTPAAAAGGLLGAAAHGVLRAAVAGATGGLGHAFRGSLGSGLLAGGLALLAGLAVLVGEGARAPLVVGRDLVPLEPNLRAGLLPSDYGQMIAVSPTAGFQDGQRYPVVLRSDPRGHRVGQLFREENIVAVPAWDVLRDVDTVILRDKHPDRADNPGFDLRIAVTREVVDTHRGPYLKLTPVDGDLNFRQLMAARGLDGPYLEFADYPFVAGVARGFQMKSGERQSLYEEPRVSGTKPNPTLRELVTLNFAGPYPDRGEPRPPLALAAPPASGLQPGTLAHLRLEAPPRGLDLGFVNRLDELEAPPWQFLAACDTAVLRHKTDPALDREIRVTHRFAFGRLRFTSPDVDFAALATDYPEHTGPHLRPPAYRFTVEVHPGARLSPARPEEAPLIADASLALIPVHMQGAPTGNPGWGIYDPHPGEVLLTDMTGPYLDEDAAGPLVRAVARPWGEAHAAIVAGSLLLLALVGLAAWARAGSAAAERLLGPAVGPAFAFVFLVCTAVGPALAATPVLRLADVAVAVAVLLGVAGILTGLVRRT
ncbi:MAG: hypothetical protein JNL82_00940 [Myxococcales bacterium]|nr:hypothetical protein [Myxococcales bacterium]